ncbi:MAG: hypothetical protein ACE5E5_14605, partial [Phycisphaerae bacterium]
MIRNTYVVLLGVLALGFGAGRADAAGPTLTVNSISMPPNSTADVVVSGSIAGMSTFGVNILVEITPRAGTMGTLEFTPEPPVDILQVGDPWPGVGIFTPFDTGTTFSTTLNGSVDDNGSLVPGPVTFTGDLSSFPVVAGAGASGVWDVSLATVAGNSNWEGLTTKLFSGTVTVAADTCSLDIHCNDGVACTDDTCVSGTCVFTPNDANCTDDGVFCNGQEVCNATAGCVSAGNPCLPTEFCNEATNACDQCQVDADCDDGLFCTGVETCVAGACQPGTDPCGGGACDEASNSCFTSATMSTGDISMPPGTTGSVLVFGAINGDSTFAANILLELVPRAGAIGTLEFTPEPPVDITQAGDPWPGVGTFTPFDTGTTLSALQNGSTDVSGSAAAPVTFSGNLSAFPVIASAGASGVWDVRLSTSVGNSNWEGLTTFLVDGSITVAVGTCSQDSHCDDGIACTVDTCVAGSCVFTPNNASCSDGNPCTDNTCNPAIGCETVNNMASCDDGNACTTGDTCSAGVCVGGAPPNCDDGNVCTDDTCNPAIGCVNTNNVAACDDGSACTTNDTCSAGVCVGGAPPNCDDGNVCTDDTCDPAVGCVNTNNVAACDDGSACTTNDTCSAGVCVGGAPPNCDDGNVCTDDTCNPATGCVNTNNVAACDDGSACTTNDTCSAGVCVGGAPPNCDDGNVCTDDSCDPATGCVNTNNTATCDDGSACTTNDTCSAGICVGGAPPNCDDGNVCTDDSCDPATGCVNTNNVAACDDGSACTTNDTCSAGV